MNRMQGYLVIALLGAIICVLLGFVVHKIFFWAAVIIVINFIMDWIICCYSKW